MKQIVQTTSFQSGRYKLIAKVACTEESIEDSQYKTMVKVGEGKWTLFKKGKVKTVSEEQVLRGEESTHLLVYQREGE